MTEDSFNVGITTVTYEAIDPSNNIATASFTVTVTGISSPYKHSNKWAVPIINVCYYPHNTIFSESWNKIN